LFSIANTIDFTLKIFEFCYGGVVDTLVAHPLKMVPSRLPAPYERGYIRVILRVFCT